MGELSWWELLLIALAAVASGAVNAIAGGGKLVVFPVLTAFGIPAVAANVTSTVAIMPGHLGAALAQWRGVLEQKDRLVRLLPVATVGGVLGGYLMLQSGEELFRELVPYLILAGSLFLAVQEKLRDWLLQRQKGNAAASQTWILIPIGLASIYGGYFGAGLSVIFLAVLGLIYSDSLTRLNALKQTLSLAVTVATSVFFLFSDEIWWGVGVVIALGSLIGGVLGGKLVTHIKPNTLRWTVVTIGVVVAIVYFVR